MTHTKFARIVALTAGILITLMLVLVVVSRGQTIPPKIDNTWIQDHANVFSPEQETALDQKVKSIGKNINFAIVTVPSTNGVDVAPFTLKLMREYGVGGATGEHRGVVYLIAIDV